jgi:hypothetical protein
VLLISNSQIALATQTIIRAAALIIIFAVPTDTEDSVQWRLVVLSDLPGLLFCCIFVMFCTVTIAKMMEGDRSKRCINLNVFIFMCFVVIVWFIAVAFLTSDTIDSATTADTMRLVVIAVLCILVICLASVAWYFAERTSRDDIIQHFGVDKAPFKWTCPVLIVCFTARLICLFFLQIDGNGHAGEKERWILVLYSSTTLYSVFVVAYFFAGEILCTIMFICQVCRFQFSRICNFQCTTTAHRVIEK